MIINLTKPTKIFLKNWRIKAFIYAIYENKIGNISFARYFRLNL